jgi:hypothetical protein
MNAQYLMLARQLIHMNTIHNDVPMLNKADVHPPNTKHACVEHTITSYALMHSIPRYSETLQGDAYHGELRHGT